MEVYTVEQVAEKLSVGVYTIREWLRTEKLHGSKIGSIWRVTDVDINALLKNEQLKNPSSTKNDNNIKENSTKETIKKVLLEQLILLSEASKREDMFDVLPELTEQMVKISVTLLQHFEQ